jgi:CelD/BcsL family acetyltransferase involved in cellulose biosynthesis
VLMRLHAARWRGLGQPGVLADRRLAVFHRLAAPALLATGALRLSVLRIAGTAAAACYTLLAPGRLLFYLSGFDPRFAHESPGTILLGRLIEDAVAEGREVHFLRGGEAYKYAWGGVDRMNATRRLVPP